MTCLVESLVAAKLTLLMPAAVLVNRSQGTWLRFTPNDSTMDWKAK